MDDPQTRPAEDVNARVESESIPDYRYFKFRSINKYLIESLVNSQLYFAKPGQLNDPFDCQLDLKKSISRAASFLSPGNRKKFMESALNHGERFVEEWKKKFENFGICSFSLEMSDSKGSPLMWSHYADQHRGVCLLYRFPASFFEDQKSQIFGVDKVKYDDDSLTNWLKDEAPLEMKGFVIGLAKIYLTAKAPAWEYEREARVIRMEHGLLDIPREYLEQICFGLGTQKTDIDFVTKLASQHCGCRNFCRIVRGENDFGISVEAM